MRFSGPGIRKVLESGPFRAVYNNIVSDPFIVVDCMALTTSGAGLHKSVATVRNGSVIYTYEYSRQELEQDPAWAPFLEEVMHMSTAFSVMES